MKVSGTVAEVIRDFKEGYRLGKPTGSGKYTILDPEGHVVRADSGMPIVLPATPQQGGPHVVKRMRSQLVQAGVIAKSADEELVERVRERSAVLSQVEDVAPILVEDTFFGPRYREVLPSIVLNVSWEEFLVMEQLAGFVADKGPRTVKQLGAYLTMVERARMLMERQVELKQLEKGAIPGGVVA